MNSEQRGGRKIGVRFSVGVGSLTLASPGCHEAARRLPAMRWLLWVLWVLNACPRGPTQPFPPGLIPARCFSLRDWEIPPRQILHRLDGSTETGRFNFFKVTAGACVLGLGSEPSLLVLCQGPPLCLAPSLPIPTFSAARV